VQGILACLVRRGITGEGGRVEVSLLESILDLQFEVITTHLNDGFKDPQRSAVRNAHAYLGAPYGIYATADGHMALAMGSIPVLGELLECPVLLAYHESQSWFDRRDEIKDILRDHLATRDTAAWLAVLEPADIWCADVLSWTRLRDTEGYRALDMEQEILCPAGTPLRTLRCPIRIDGSISKSPVGAPAIGQHTAGIDTEFSI
jgi:crotonobetainyl-CoA:carnitine CoA-transferase CaiB-like acyl-CoA transferase